MPIAANVASYYVKRSGSNIFQWLVMQPQQQQQEQQQHVANRLSLEADQPDQQQVLMLPPLCYSLPTHTTPATATLIPIATATPASTASATSNERCPWSAHEEFPIAIKNIYNANATDQRQ